MSDIHGCYDEFMQMLQIINFSASDTLIIAGDYIDRGPKSYEMLLWMETKPEHVIMVVGNHDKEFAYNVQLMRMVMDRDIQELDIYSAEHTQVLCELVAQLAAQQGGGCHILIITGPSGK
jgi:serine/threonine protein phosphatase 1